MNCQETLYDEDGTEYPCGGELVEVGIIPKGQIPSPVDGLTLYQISMKLLQCDTCKRIKLLTCKNYK